MNLNFIQDNDKIHVETQNQIAYKQEIILKAKLLKQDFQDYSLIHPSLNHINIIFSEIVKDLYEQVTNHKQKPTQTKKFHQLNQNDPIQSSKKKKKVSIPYGTIKKLQNLKQKFISCKNIIDSQNARYRSLNINKQNQKKSDVRFYKFVLQSYENQRQYFKKQTLDLEDSVQQIQAVVKSLSYNQNHKFTDFESKVITFQSIFKYEKKMNALKKVVDQLKLIHKTKSCINKFLNVESTSQKENYNCKDLESLFYAKNLVRNVEDMQKKVNLLRRQKSQILQTQINYLINQIQKARCVNKKLKRAILQAQREKYFVEMEERIKKFKRKLLNQKKNVKITKTDFMIYLKELDNRIKEYFKFKQIVYRCKSSFINPNLKFRSKSFNISKS